MAEPGLTTHVLDVSRGHPAAGVRIELFALEGDRRRKITETYTTADGRPERPLLSGNTMPIGLFELLFHVGDYYHAIGITLSEPPFIDQVPIHFGISDRVGHYHIPLLVTPYGYSTYRGS